MPLAAVHLYTCDVNPDHRVWAPYGMVLFCGEHLTVRGVFGLKTGALFMLREVAP